MLDGILADGLENLNEDKLRGMLSFANAAASLVTTRRGAIKSMPDRDEVKTLMLG
jgi:fructokinase